MNWFRNMRAGAKLLLGFGIMIALLGSTMVLAYRTIAVIRDSEQKLFEQDFTGVVAMVELRSHLNEQRVQALQMIVSQDSNRQEALARHVKSRIKDIDDSLQRLATIYAGDPAILTKFDELKATMDTFRRTRERIFDLIFAGSKSEAGALLDGVQAEHFAKLQDLSLALGNGMMDRARARISASSELAARSTWMFAVLVALALISAVFLTMTLSWLIARPLVEIAGVAGRIAAGDLTVTLAEDQRTDEVGTLLRAFRAMLENLRGQLGELVEGANVLGSAASEILASTTQLAASASESAAAVSETTTTVEEVRQTAQVASQKARAVSDSAQKAAQNSQSGRKSTEDMGAGMKRIRQQMEAIAASMVRLSEQSQAIGQIIATVEDLAAQSNLLAVNAAIEAAKAGEQGKGFGVVAQEVKSLAEQSRQATGQVRTILGDIQKATSAAVMATEQGGKAVEAGAVQSETAGAAIQALATSANEAAQAATQIAASSQQQLVGVGQVAGAMESIKQASAQNVAGAKQLETAASNLNDLGQRLKQMVGRYQV